MKANIVIRIEDPADSGQYVEAKFKGIDVDVLLKNDTFKPIHRLLLSFKALDRGDIGGALFEGLGGKPTDTYHGPG